MSYNLDKSQTRDPQSIWSTGSKIKVQTSSEEVQALIRYSRISERRPLKVVGTCFAARRSEFYISNAFFLIFLFTLSALTVFSIPENMPQARLPTTYTIMLSSISFKWVFNRSLPAVPYLTVLDKYSISGILFINLLAAWHALVGKYNKQWDPQVDKYVMFGFLALFLIEHLFFLIVYFIITRKKRFLQHEEYKFIRKFLKENRLTSLKQIEEEDIY